MTCANLLFRRIEAFCNVPHPCERNLTISLKETKLLN